MTSDNSRDLLFTVASFLRPLRRFLLCFVGKLSFACFCCSKFRLEAVDTTFGVDDFLFTGKERVRSGRDVYLHERVGIAIFPFDSLVRWRGALRQECKACHIVAKYDRTVGWWVNTAFHNLPIVSDSRRNVKGAETRAILLL